MGPAPSERGRQPGHFGRSHVSGTQLGTILEPKDYAGNDVFGDSVANNGAIVTGLGP